MAGIGILAMAGQAKKMTGRQYGSRIAIVDDDPELVQLLTKMLDVRGIQACFSASDGDEAVARFVNSSPMPDIVITDYRMPTMNGLEAMREILRIKPDTKIIFLSANIEIKEEALEAGAAAFLNKPASIKDIYQAIDSAADSIDAPH
jgi:CheY-like chemotaxis protein